jgi:hypothetical protein
MEQEESSSKASRWADKRLDGWKWKMQALRYRLDCVEADSIPHCNLGHGSGFHVNDLGGKPPRHLLLG